MKCCRSDSSAEAQHQLERMLRTPPSTAHRIGWCRRSSRSRGFIVRPTTVPSARPGTPQPSRGKSRLRVSFAYRPLNEPRSLAERQTALASRRDPASCARLIPSALEARTTTPRRDASGSKRPFGGVWSGQALSTGTARERPGSYSWPAGRRETEQRSAACHDPHWRGGHPTDERAADGTCAWIRPDVWSLNPASET